MSDNIYHGSKYRQFIGEAAPLPATLPTRLQTLRYMALTSRSGGLGGYDFFSKIAKEILDAYPELGRRDPSNLTRSVGFSGMGRCLEGADG